MFILNRIKYDADKNYDIYEKIILDNKVYLSKNLTDYIYNIYIQRNIYGIFYDNKTIKYHDIKYYVQNIYISYYDYYIKNIINDNNDFIITDKILTDFVTCNKNKNKKEYEWCNKYSNINIPIDEYIKNIFLRIYILPPFVRYGLCFYDIYIFIAKLLDYIIELNNNKIIIMIAMGHLV